MSKWNLKASYIAFFIPIILYVIWYFLFRDFFQYMVLLFAFTAITAPIAGIRFALRGAQGILKDIAILLNTVELIYVGGNSLLFVSILFED